MFLCYHYRFRSCLCPPITVNSSQRGQRVDLAPGQRRGGLGAYWTAAMSRVPPQPGAGGTAHPAVSGPSPRTDIGPTSASRLQRRHKQCSTRVHSAAKAEGDRKISALPATSASGWTQPPEPKETERSPLCLRHQRLDGLSRQSRRRPKDLRSACLRHQRRPWVWMDSAARAEGD